MKNHKSFLAGMLTMLLITCLFGSASATRGVVQKEIEYQDIKISLDGVVLDLRDAQGNPVEPFKFGGTNYVPARALAEALGLTVAWDGATSTVVLAHPQPIVNEPVDTGLPSTSGGGSGSEYGPGTPGWTGDENNFNTWNLPEQQNTTDRYVLNTKSLKVHEPSCREVPKIAPQNYLTSNADIETLFGQGYSYCGVCH
ncbi:stalk domain-containing protein [Oscillospiraceae bacterium 38-13]